MLIHNKDDIQFVAEFPCFLGHPVYNTFISLKSKASLKKELAVEIKHTF